MATTAPLWRDAVRRLRHVHIPDTPPCYSPFVTSRWLQEEVEDIIRTAGRERAIASKHSSDGTPWWYNADQPDLSKPHRLLYWLLRSPPPPVVISSTQRPTFVVPPLTDDQKKRLWWPNSEDALVENEDPLLVAFPKPPEWSASPWGEPTPHEPEILGRSAGSDRRFDLTSFRWQQVKMVDSYKLRIGEVRGGEFHPFLEQATYQGPGTLSIVVGFDVYDIREDEALKQKKTEFYHHKLEQATIAVLDFEYGLRVFPVDGLPGLWVQTRHKRKQVKDNIRQIATINCSKLDGVVRFTVSINVGQPTVAMVRGDDVRNNPWAHIEQQEQATSIVAELTEDTLERVQNHGGPSPSIRYERPAVKVNDAGRHFERDDSFYSLIHWKGRGLHQAPMGLENYDLASAWTFELAAQLGIENVDQMGQHTNVRSSIDFFMHTVSERRTRQRLDRPLGHLLQDVARLDFDNLRRPVDPTLIDRGWIGFGKATGEMLRDAASAKKQKMAKKYDTRLIHLKQIVPAAPVTKAPVSRMARSQEINQRAWAQRA